MPSSSSSLEPDHGAALRRQGDTEGVVSFLRTQHDVDAVCEKYGVPKDRYPARPAGDLRASSPPPAGCLCVHQGESDGDVHSKVIDMLLNISSSCEPEPDDPNLINIQLLEK
ncbi:hypothetical protein D1007_41791 [Hordeum vulgare]|nr:hypothetical protein D1007_41791 [Hordeum vulgare]